LARHLYFAFHYQRDIWRVNQVRNCWVTFPNATTAGFYDDSLWEDSKKKGDEAIKRMILNGLAGTSVTAVLIGAQTSERRWVRFEIDESIRRGNGVIGIYVCSLKDKNGNSDIMGANPLDKIQINVNGVSMPASSYYRTYMWFSDDGPKQMGTWVDLAAKQAGR